MGAKPLVCLLTLFILQPMVSVAVLGGSAATVGLDGQPVASEHALAQRTSGVQQHTVVTAQNVTVTEYSAGGAVFALYWSGPVMPDLSQLLGTYFPQYADTLRTSASSARNSPVSIKTSTLVAHASGHMRAYSGSAYAPALVPAGVNLVTLGVEP